MKTKNKIIAVIILILLVFWIAKSVYSYYFVPGVLDDFAKCLNEKGAIMYGAIEWCEFTKMQAKMFGKSFKYVNYQDYSKFPSSLGAIKKTPTWALNNKSNPGVQSLEYLGQLTGCVLPS